MHPDSINFECACCGDVSPIDDATTCPSCHRPYCWECFGDHYCRTIDLDPLWDGQQDGHA